MILLPSSSVRLRYICRLDIDSRGSLSAQDELMRTLLSLCASPAWVSAARSHRIGHTRRRLRNDAVSFPMLNRVRSRVGRACAILQMDLRDINAVLHAGQQEQFTIGRCASGEALSLLEVTAVLPKTSSRRGPPYCPRLGLESRLCRF